jgi:hypothetical protein
LLTHAGLRLCPAALALKRIYLRPNVTTSVSSQDPFEAYGAGLRQTAIYTSFTGVSQRVEQLPHQKYKQMTP